MRCLFHLSEQQKSEEIITLSSGKDGRKQVHSYTADGSNMAKSTKNKSTTFLSLSNLSFEKQKYAKIQPFVVVKNLLERNLSINNQGNNLWDIYNVGYYAHVKK